MKGSESTGECSETKLSPGQDFHFQTSITENENA